MDPQNQHDAMAWLAIPRDVREQTILKALLLDTTDKKI